VRIAADATDKGDGGKVVVWADDTTDFRGTISARGGANGGDGGWVEVSGRNNLAFSGTVDTRAPNGYSGSLLLDPATITIIDVDAPPGAADDAQAADGNILAADGGATGFLISRGQLEALGSATNIVLEATGQITVNDMASDVINLQTGSGFNFTLRSTTSGGIAFVDANDEIRTAGGNIALEAQGGGSLTNIGKLTTNGGNAYLWSATSIGPRCRQPDRYQGRSGDADRDRCHHQRRRRRQHRYHPVWHSWRQRRKHHGQRSKCSARQPHGERYRRQQRCRRR
jgi:hypothetical protein